MSANGVPEVLKGSRMSEETVKALSSFKDEPGWLTEKRLGAWRAFEELPMPTLRDEAWRYTDISDVSPEDFSPYVPSPEVSSEGDLPDAVQKLIEEGEENSALLVQHNSEKTFQRMDEELRSKGVIFTDMHTALRDHEEIVRDRLFGLVPEDYDKFSALSAALFAGGSFLYVPRGVDVEVPIQSYRWLDVTGSIMARPLVVVEEGATVTSIDEYASSGGEEPALSNGAVELFVGQGANVHYVSLQNWERTVLHFNPIRSSAGRDAVINSLVVSLGSELCRTIWRRTRTRISCTRVLSGTSRSRYSAGSSGSSRGRRRPTPTRPTGTSSWGRMTRWRSVCRTWRSWPTTSSAPTARRRVRWTTRSSSI